MEENNNKNENAQNVNTEENVTENATANEEVKEGEVIGADGFSEKEKEDGKVMAILSYISLLSLIPYFTEKENKWVRFHAIQGVNLLIIEAIFMVIGMIGWVIGWICNIIVLVLSIIGIVNVCNGETKELPIVGGIKFIKQ
jgi:uncharacterized membrane protein